MKKKLNNNIGFTLIEIIVVLIIIGILAAIGVPNIFSNVAKSRAAEALANIAIIRPVIEQCIAKHPYAESTCTMSYMFPGQTLLEGDIELQGTNFAYRLGPANMKGSTLNDGNTGYSLIAYEFSPNCSGPTGTGPSSCWGADYIKTNRSSASTPGIGTMSCLGGGVLTGAC